MIVTHNLKDAFDAQTVGDSYITPCRHRDRVRMGIQASLRLKRPILIEK